MIEKSAHISGVNSRISLDYCNFPRNVNVLFVLIITISNNMAFRAISE
jgi:hypothetical protein